MWRDSDSNYKAECHPGQMNEVSATRDPRPKDLKNINSNKTLKPGVNPGFFCFMAGGSIPCSNKPVGKLRAEYPLPCVMPACFKRESKTRNHLGFRVAGKSPELKQRFAFGSATRRESSRRLCLTFIEVQKEQQSAPRRATIRCPHAPHYAASGIVSVPWPLP